MKKQHIYDIKHITMVTRQGMVMQTLVFPRQDRVISWCLCSRHERPTAHVGCDQPGLQCTWTATPELRTFFNSINFTDIKLTFVVAEAETDPKRNFAFKY